MLARRGIFDINKKVTPKNNQLNQYKNFNNVLNNSISPFHNLFFQYSTKYKCTQRINGQTFSFSRYFQENNQIKYSNFYLTFKRNYNTKNEEIKQENEEKIEEEVSEFTDRDFFRNFREKRWEAARRSCLLEILSTSNIEELPRLVKAYALIIIEYLHVPSEMATNSEELHIKCGQLVEKFLSKCELKVGNELFETSNHCLDQILQLFDKEICEKEITLFYSPFFSKKKLFKEEENDQVEKIKNEIFSIIYYTKGEISKYFFQLSNSKQYFLSGKENFEKANFFDEKFQPSFSLLNTKILRSIAFFCLDYCRYLDLEKSKGIILSDVPNYEKEKEQILNIADDSFSKSIDVNSEDVESWYGRGQISEMREKWEEAIPFYREASKLSKEYAPAWYSLGDCFLRINQYSGAVSSYDKFLEYGAKYYEITLSPESVKLRIHDVFGQVFFKKGCAYLKVGDMKSAVKDFENCISLADKIEKSTLAKAYHFYAKCSLRMGNHWKVIEDNTKALELNPSLAGAYYDRSRAYTVTGRNDLAENDLRYYSYLQSKSKFER